MKDCCFIIKKEIFSGINIEGGMARYRMEMRPFGTDRNVHSFSLEDLKEIAAFLTAYVEKEEKEKGGAK